MRKFYFVIDVRGGKKHIHKNIIAEDSDAAILKAIKETLKSDFGITSIRIYKEETVL